MEERARSDRIGILSMICGNDILLSEWDLGVREDILASWSNIPDEKGSSGRQHAGAVRQHGTPRQDHFS